MVVAWWFIDSRGAVVYRWSRGNIWNFEKAIDIHQGDEYNIAKSDDAEEVAQAIHLQRREIRCELSMIICVKQSVSTGSERYHKSCGSARYSTG